MPQKVSFDMPRPLLPRLEACAPYPVDALGEVLGGAANAIISAVQVPDALAAQSVLAAAAMAAQPHANVVRGGQEIPLSIFCLSVGESGDRKSSADRIALSAHHSHQNRLVSEFARTVKEHRDATDVFQRCRAAVLGRRGEPDTLLAELAKLKEPKNPPSPFILCVEPTLEGLHKSFLHGHPSQGFFSDEGGQFLGGHSFRPENMLKTVSGLSRMWDGEPITRTRAKEGENASRSGCRLSAHLLIQPAVAQEVLTSRVLLGQGFLARFLVAWPESLSGHRLYRDADPTKDPRLVCYWQRMNDLLTLACPLNATGDLAPPPLHLEREALSAWIKMHDEVEVSLGRGGDLLEIKPTAAKAAENALRIAGVFAITEGSSSITRPLVERAAMLMRWYLEEALRVLHPIKIDTHLIEAQKLFEWLCARDWQQFYGRDLQRLGPRFARKSAAYRNQLLRVLVEHRMLTATGNTLCINPLASPR